MSISGMGRKTTKRKRLRNLHTYSVRCVRLTNTLQSAAKQFIFVFTCPGAGSPTPCVDLVSKTLNLCSREKTHMLHKFHTVDVKETFPELFTVPLLHAFPVANSLCAFHVHHK